MVAEEGLMCLFGEGCKVYVSPKFLCPTPSNSKRGKL